MLISFICLEAALLGLWWDLQRGNRVLNASLLAKSAADYSDRPPARIPEVGLAIIEDMILDSDPQPADLYERLASITAVLLSPVPTATPQASPSSNSPTPSQSLATNTMLEPSRTLPPTSMLETSPTVTPTLTTSTASPTGGSQASLTPQPTQTPRSTQTLQPTPAPTLKMKPTHTPRVHPTQANPPTPTKKPESKPPTNTPKP